MRASTAGAADSGDDVARQRQLVELLLLWAASAPAAFAASVAAVHGRLLGVDAAAASVPSDEQFALALRLRRDTWLRGAVRSCSAAPLALRLHGSRMACVAHGRGSR